MKSFLTLSFLLLAAFAWGEDASLGRKYEGTWIDEDADTFSRRNGTGVWEYRKPADITVEPDAKVDEVKDVGQAIKINAWEGASVLFTPTNDAQSVLNATTREFKFNLYSEIPGYSTSLEARPQPHQGDIAGVTIACDDGDNGKLHFAVLDPETRDWVMLPDTVAKTNQLYTFKVVVSYPNTAAGKPGSVAYYSDQSADPIAVITPSKGIPDPVPAFATKVRFAGCGYIRDFQGECWDAHAVALGKNEYWTVADAIREIGDSGRILTPLMPCTYSADVGAGRFGVRDPNGYLTVEWPLGYVVETTEDGDVRYYVFHLSDYWADWAVAEDATAVPNGWEVKSANGLAWLVKESQSAALVGDITLTTDITNLYEHVWCPIREFKGTFDGKNHKLCGLGDKGVEICTTNDLMTAYGLFGTAVDSTFRNVAFENVAISNSADAVASLLGCSLGDLTLTNVTVRSGSIAGGGKFVSGIVGYVSEFKNVSIAGNRNEAAVSAPEAAALGGATVSGVANLGSNGDAPGSLSVVNNGNGGAFATTISSAVGGGNVAQIVAGSDSDAKFAAVTVTGNSGTGDVSRVESVNHDAWSIGDLPIVNLGAEVSRQSNGEDYKQFIEANDSSDALLDPYLKTARMTGSFYQNGNTNVAGRLNDQISASLPGATVTLQESGEFWSPVVLDRAITLDLDGKVIDNVFDGYTFEVSPGAGAKVKNGTATHPEGKLANREVGDGWTTEGLNTVVWNEDYWDRGIFVNGEFVDSLVALSATLKPLSSAPVSVSIPEDSGFSVDIQNGTLDYHGKPALSLPGCRFVDNGDGSYLVELDESDDPGAAFTINLALAPNGGESKVVLTGAKVGVEYCLQSVESLAEAWDKPTDKWVSVSKDGEVLEFEVDTSKPSGFYRIKTKVK